jgi:hypothetical protein
MWSNAIQTIDVCCPAVPEMSLQFAPLVALSYAVMQATVTFLTVEKSKAGSVTVELFEHEDAG